MKRFLFFGMPFLVIPFLTCFSSFSQAVISSTANEVSNNDFVISYSIGEVATITLSSENIVVTQGFLQPYIIKPTGFEDRVEVNSYAYPNPASDILIFRDNSVNGSIAYFINILGVEVKKGLIRDNRISLQSLTPGTYTILINSIPKKSEPIVFKIVKI